MDKKRASKIEAHKEATKERTRHSNDLRISFKKIKDEPAFAEIMRMAKGFADYHSKMAKDGVGYRDNGNRDISGNPQQEIVYFTNEKRVSEMDKAAGIEEVIDYLVRNTSGENLKPLVSKKTVS